MDYALLSQAVYDLGTAKYKAPSGWEAVGLPGLVCLVDPKKAAFIGVENGFKASAFIKGKTLAVVFQGTNPAELVDWTTDIAAAMGFAPGQYADVLDFVGQVTKEAGTKFGVVLTGHSLGGGLATYAALHYDKPAIVFNAAPMGAGMLGDVGDMSGKKSLVKNIDMKGDPASGLGGQIGPVYWLEVPAAVQSQIDRTRLAAGPGFAVNNLEQLHSIANIITALQTLSR
jgi:pimeloyl-ACP methyl ester carboxylesterase